MVLCQSLTHVNILPRKIRNSLIRFMRWYKRQLGRSKKSGLYSILPVRTNIAVATTRKPARLRSPLQEHRHVKTFSWLTALWLGPTRKYKKKELLLLLYPDSKSATTIHIQYSNLWHFYGRLYWFEGKEKKLKTAGGYESLAVYVSRVPCDALYPYNLLFKVTLRLLLGQKRASATSK